MLGISFLIHVNRKPEPKPPGCGQSIVNAPKINKMVCSTIKKKRISSIVDLRLRTLI